MPLIQDGENYRSFSEPSTFEAETQAQVRQIELPTDKAFAFVGDPAGATFELWRFNALSVAAASATVLVPNNPMYAALGRWIKMPISGGGPGAGGLQSGSGSPESVTDASGGQFYWDTDALPSGQTLYANLATSGTTGWFALLQF